MNESGQQSNVTLDEEIIRFELAWGRLLSAIARVPIDRTEEPGVCGEWSLKILLGHISFWDRFEIEHIAHRGELGEVDWESANQENARASAGRMYAEVLAELRENHEQLVSLVRSLPDLNPTLVRELTYDHYVEHGAEIEAWLNGTNPKDLHVSEATSG